MNFQKSFDELFNGILTDYQNQFPEADTSKGSLIFIKSACLASATWGIYQYQDWIARQGFPDTAALENLEHHASVRGITRKTGETAEALLERVLEDMRNPPAGGNKYDYERWAKEVTDVRQAYCYPLARGVGTVDVVIFADEGTTGSEVPNQALIDQVQAYIDDLRPCGFDGLKVFAPTILLQNVTMTLVGTASTADITSDIEAYLDSFIPKQVLYPAQLSAIAIDNGADNATVTAPAAPVTPVNYETIRPGVVTIA